MRNEMVTIPIAAGETVSGILSIPDSDAMAPGIIIAHGAGNDMNQPMLRFLAEGLADAGYPTLRFNFLYKEQGKNPPDRQDVLYQAWEGAYKFLHEHLFYRIQEIIAVGKSMGGRIASQMVTEGRLSVSRLIFLGYPLHPPGKKEKLRDAHLYKIQNPMLFFAGTKDHLCDLELLKNVLSVLQAPWKLEVIDGGDHSFNVPKAFKIDQEVIYRHILKAMLLWLKEDVFVE
jgi:predicted alpha/beta-hydrolase family hydrolase